MLFPLLPQAVPPIAEAGRWTAQVKAFAYYITPDCLPQERLATVYLARKTFEDGSTVTILRNVPLDPLATAHPIFSGSGLIQRDPHGATTHVVTQLLFSPVNGPFGQSEFRLDPKSGSLVGGGRYGDTWGKGLTLADRKALLLDPLEGFAFGAPAGWLFPTADYGYLDSNAARVGMRGVLGPPQAFAFELGGRREMFQRLDMGLESIGASDPIQGVLIGQILLHADGSFASYNIGYLCSGLPGRVGWAGTYGKSNDQAPAPPPFALKGKLAKMWDQGLDPRLTFEYGNTALGGVIVPAAVSAAERDAMIAQVPAPEKTVEATDPAEKTTG